jgi:hypothetical protein
MRSSQAYNPDTQASPRDLKDELMYCARCQIPISADDNFCRKCGTAIDLIDVPAVRSEAVPVRVWRDARPAIARGVALVAAGAVLRVLVGQVIKAIATRSIPGGGTGRRLLPLAGGRSIARGVEEVEIFLYRRVRR